MSLRAAVRFAGRLAKLGNSTDECEDAFAFAPKRFAVSDGATESSYSSIWAEILTRTFCALEGDVETPAGLRSWLEACREEWRVWEASMSARDDLPWFTREKLRSGAFATFVGMSLRELDWVAVAHGDACLFVVRDDVLINAFPVESGADFNNSPLLVSTREDAPLDGFGLRSGVAAPGDRMYLASDAMAHWFFADIEAGQKPWDAWDGISSVEDFQIFVDEERARHQMRNDDVTLLSLELVDD
jgi:hypothetical protein